MFCLDTNVIVRLMNGRVPALRHRFEAERRVGSRLALSVVALFELRFGAANSARPEANMRALERMLDGKIEIWTFDAGDAAEASQIRAYLSAHGTPIGPYDALIAGQARRHGATLVTSKMREFQRVPGLMVMDWAA
jgi:tRNA(fMet)-specific endonuclease VapC